MLRVIILGITVMCKQYIRCEAIKNAGVQVTDTLTLIFIPQPLSLRYKGNQRTFSHRRIVNEDSIM